MKTSTIEIALKVTSASQLRLKWIPTSVRSPTMRIAAPWRDEPGVRPGSQLGRSRMWTTSGIGRHGPGVPVRDAEFTRLDISLELDASDVSPGAVLVRLDRPFADSVIELGSAYPQHSSGFGDREPQCGEGLGRGLRPAPSGRLRHRWGNSPGRASSGEASWCTTLKRVSSSFYPV